MLLLFKLFLFIHVYGEVQPAYKNIFVSGKPSVEDLAAFRKKNGAVIVDLRSFDELGACREPVNAIKLGLAYQRVDFDKSIALKPEVIGDIDAKVKDANDKPVLLFCQTGNRAAAWLAIHLWRDEKMSLDEAIRTARKVGLKSDMESAVRAFAH